MRRETFTNWWRWFRFALHMFIYILMYVCINYWSHYNSSYLPCISSILYPVTSTACQFSYYNLLYHILWLLLSRQAYWELSSRRFIDNVCMCLEKEITTKVRRRGILCICLCNVCYSVSFFKFFHWKYSDSLLFFHWKRKYYNIYTCIFFVCCSLFKSWKPNVSCLASRLTPAPFSRVYPNSPKLQRKGSRYQCSPTVVLDRCVVVVLPCCCLFQKYFLWFFVLFCCIRLCAIEYVVIVSVVVEVEVDWFLLCSWISCLQLSSIRFSLWVL